MQLSCLSAAITTHVIFHLKRSPKLHFKVLPRAVMRFPGTLGTQLILLAAAHKLHIICLSLLFKGQHAFMAKSIPCTDIVNCHRWQSSDGTLEGCMDAVRHKKKATSVSKTTYASAVWIQTLSHGHTVLRLSATKASLSLVLSMAHI